MPTEVKQQTLLAVGASTYWQLRLDRGFDLYCAELDGAEYTLHSQTEDVDEAGNVVVIVESTLTYPKEALPAPIQSLLGNEPFRCWSRFRFWRDKFDSGHLASFETRPSVLSGKLVISGDCWCEELDATSCRFYTRHEASCRVFGVGGLIENTLLSQVKATYKGLSDCTRAYMGTEAYNEFLHAAGRPGSPPAAAAPLHRPLARSSAAPATPRAPPTPMPALSRPLSWRSASPSWEVGGGGEALRQLDEDDDTFWAGRDTRGSLVVSAFARVVDKLRSSLAGDSLAPVSDGDVFSALAASARGQRPEGSPGASGSGASVGGRSPPSQGLISPFPGWPDPRSGWLHKRGVVNTARQKRWFTLEAGWLTW